MLLHKASGLATARSANRESQHVVRFSLETQCSYSTYCLKRAKVIEFAWYNQHHSTNHHRCITKFDFQDLVLKTTPLWRYIDSCRFSIKSRPFRAGALLGCQLPSKKWGSCNQSWFDWDGLREKCNPFLQMLPSKSGRVANGELGYNASSQWQFGGMEGTVGNFATWYVGARHLPCLVTFCFVSSHCHVNPDLVYLPP